MNKTIKNILKKNLDTLKGALVDGQTLLCAMGNSHHEHDYNRGDPFSMAYRVKAMSPFNVGLPSPQHLHFNEISNEEIRRYELDFLEEKRNDSQIRLAS